MDDRCTTELMVMHSIFDVSNSEYSAAAVQQEVKYMSTMASMQQQQRQQQPPPMTMMGGATTAPPPAYYETMQIHSHQIPPFSQQQLGCLYTKQKTQKRKTWSDGRLVIRSSGIALHSAHPSPGMGDPVLDQLELIPSEIHAVQPHSTIETELYLIRIEGPWLPACPPSIPTPTIVPSIGMQKVMTRKFQKPAPRIPPPSSSQHDMPPKKRPLQPGELIQQYYGIPIPQSSATTMTPHSAIPYQPRRPNTNVQISPQHSSVNEYQNDFRSASSSASMHHHNHNHHSDRSMNPRDNTFDPQPSASSNVDHRGTTNTKRRRHTPNQDDIDTPRAVTSKRPPPSAVITRPSHDPPTHRVTPNPVTVDVGGPRTVRTNPVRHEESNLPVGPMTIPPLTMANHVFASTNHRSSGGDWLGLDFDDEELGTAVAGTTTTADPSAPATTTSPLNVRHDTPVAPPTIQTPPPMLHPTNDDRNENNENTTLSHTQLLDLFQFPNNENMEPPPSTTNGMTTTTTNDPTIPLGVVRASDSIGTATTHHQPVGSSTTLQEAFIDEFKLPSDDEDEFLQ